MPIGGLNRDTGAPKRETFRPPWVKDTKEAAADQPPSWTQKKLKPVETKAAPPATEKEPEPTAKPNLKPALKKQSTVRDKPENGVAEKIVMPSERLARQKSQEKPKPSDKENKTTKTVTKPVDTKKNELNSKPAETTKTKSEPVKTNEVPKPAEEPAKPVNRFRKTTDSSADKAANKDTAPAEKVPEKVKPNYKIVKKSTEPKPIDKVEEAKAEEKTKTMATKPPPAAEKSQTKTLPPRKPSLQKAPSRDEIGVKKWRDPLHERVKENIDKTLSEPPKGHTLTKNESLRSLLKPTPPPMPPPLPPKCPPPPDFKKPEITLEKLKKLESLKSRPRKRPDWSDMMKEVEEGKKLRHVVCNDRSSPIITTATVVKQKGEFIFESEKQTKHNELLKEINMGVKLKKVKTNDRSKPNLEGLRKFRRQMTIEEQLQKSMSQVNMAAAKAMAGDAAEIPEMPLEDEDIDEMDDIDKVRDDLQSTKQLLAIELRNKEAQTRENKRLLTKIQNLEAELARERAIILQEQQKTVISVTDAYDEKLVLSLKTEVERAKMTADDLEKQYLKAAEERDDAQSELEELKRKNSELEKKLQQAISGIVSSNANSRRSSHAVKQLSIQRDSSFEEEEEESEEEEDESEEKKQKRAEKELKNMRNKIRHLKQKQDRMKQERVAYKMQLKNQQAALKDAKTKYKELKREVDKMAAMMKDAGSGDEDESEEEEEEEEEEKKSETEEDSESETEADTESETESESEPEDAPPPKKKENLTKRVKRHESRVNALKKGNTLLVANVDRLKDDVNKQREEAAALQKELDSLVEDFA